MGTVFHTRSDKENFHPDSLLGKAKVEAMRQIEMERFHEEVQKAKAKLLARKWWHRFIPVITITWRTK